jgi:hypothetical protein
LLFGPFNFFIDKIIESTAALIRCFICDISGPESKRDKKRDFCIEEDIVEYDVLVGLMFLFV